MMMKNTLSTTLTIKSLRLPCFLGVYERERQHRQWVEVEVQLCTHYDKLRVQDEVDNVVNYEKIVQAFRNLTFDTHYHLIETLCGDLVACVERDFPEVLEVKVKVCKQAPLQDVACCCCEMRGKKRV